MDFKEYCKMDNKELFDFTCDGANNVQLWTKSN